MTKFTFSPNYTDN